MPDLEKIMGVSASDIEKVMGVSKDNIEKVMGVSIPAGVPVWAGVTGIQFGGDFSGYSNQIQYKTIQSASDTQDFGNLVVARTHGSGAASNTTRAIMFDGQDDNTDDGESYSVTVMDYVTVGSTGNASDFGDLLLGSNGATGAGGGAMSNGTLAFNTDGYVSGTSAGSDMSYVTIASTGNSTNAGDMTQSGWSMGSSSGDSRGLIWHGWSLGFSNLDIIEYQAFHTSNNASDFGDAISSEKLGATVASSARSVHAHGSYGVEKRIDYVTVASTGDASDFGDTSSDRWFKFSGCSDGTRGEWWGGYKDYEQAGAADDDRIEYITIASTGDSSDGADIHTAGQLYNSATSGT